MGCPALPPHRRLPLLLLPLAAVLLFSSPSLAQAPPLLEGRVRVSHGIRHDGFLYKGKHWLGGTVHTVSADTLVLWTSSGGGFLSIPAGWITEFQVRPAQPPPDSPLAALAARARKWTPAPLPVTDMDALREIAVQGSTAPERAPPDASEKSSQGAAPGRSTWFAALGWGQMQLPKNDHPFFTDSPLPDGETIDYPVIHWGSTRPDGLGGGISWAGYSVTKPLHNELLQTTVAHHYEVSYLALHLRYEPALGSNPSGPRVGLRAGVALNMIDFELRTTTVEEVQVGGFTVPTAHTETDPDDAKKMGPYVGVDAVIPLGRSPFSAFVIVEKTWVTHDYSHYGGVDVQLGPVSYGVGVAYGQ